MAPDSPNTPVSTVRLEVRVGAARPAIYEVGDGGFLVGGTAGCDLRLPGAATPPVICLIARHASGASLRRLAPMLPLQINGRAAASTYLSDGDVIQVGPPEMQVRLTIHVLGQTGDPLAERLRELSTREQQLDKQRQELEAVRVIWERRRAEIEEECRQQVARLEEMAQHQMQVHPDVAEELAQRQAEVEASRAEVETTRQELARIRQELSDRYQDRRDRILAQHQALRRAARKIQKRKQVVDEREAQQTALQTQLEQHRTEIEASRDQLARERQIVEEQHRLFSSRQQESQRDLYERTLNLEERENRLREAQAALEQGQKLHQTDLVRLDRIQAGIERKTKLLQERALEVDRRFEALSRSTRELEEQATQLDEWHTRLTLEDERMSERRTALASQADQLEQRAAQLEGQQTMLATLRTRLERLRDELRQQEQEVSDQRALQQASESDIAQRMAEAEALGRALLNERDLFEEERRRFDERRQTLDQAITRLREAQDALDREQADAQSRQAELENAGLQQQDQAALLLARGEQLEQLNARLTEEREALRERETRLTRAEQMLQTLQEQVRRRVDDLESRSRQLATREQAMTDREAAFAEQCRQIEEVQVRTQDELEQARQDLETQARELAQRTGELARQADRVSMATGHHSEAQESLEMQRRGLEAERVAFELEKQAAQERERQAREEFARCRDDAAQMLRQLPELELRATAALERLAAGREQLREHLAEVHAYARQSREDLEAARQAVQAEGEKLRKQELELGVARDEHRLAVAGFRHQLIEWQGRVSEMRQSLQMGSSQLELRQAEIEARAREVADDSARLAAEAQLLEREKRVVAERRGEMDRHLTDMREWYRKKLRELAGVDVPPDAEPGEGDVVPLPAPEQPPEEIATHERSPARAVLTLNDEVAPADRQLGELLASLELVDDDTLQALWAEARRQRRSLRQLLLAGGYLTLYQMALIEAGNLDGLVLGPVRVIDRLPSTPREAVYRVFDPRRNAEAILRHLSESEMHDAVRPDEFRQRFAAAAAVRHPNVAGVLEVLDISGRPAALCEAVHGLAAADWPPLASAPGSWYRLVSQAAVGLLAIHDAGLAHGHLDAGSLVLGGEGTLKIVGLGEPAWLAPTLFADNDSPQADLQALGLVAGAWAAAPPGGKGARSKPLPPELQAILARLVAGESEQPYQSARELLEDLEQIGNKVQATNTAWDRLLRHVRDQAAPVGLRMPA
ncbi:MAG: hypothetical protein U0840_17215 [Gemmataceae bacterium]